MLTTGAGKAHQWRFGPRFPGRRHLTGSPPQAQPTVTFATGPTPRGGGRSHVERKIGYISGLYTRFGRSAHASARAKEGSAGTGPRRSLRYWCLCSPELWSSLAPAFTPASTPCVPKPPPTGRRFKRLWIPSGRKCCRLPNSRRGSKAHETGSRRTVMAGRSYVAMRDATRAIETARRARLADRDGADEA